MVDIKKIGIEPPSTMPGIDIQPTIIVGPDKPSKRLRGKTQAARKWLMMQHGISEGDMADRLELLAEIDFAQTPVSEVLIENVQDYLFFKIYSDNIDIPTDSFEENGDEIYSELQILNSLGENIAASSCALFFASKQDEGLVVVSTVIYDSTFFVSLQNNFFYEDEHGRVSLVDGVVDGVSFNDTAGSQEGSEVISAAKFAFIAYDVGLDSESPIAATSGKLYIYGFPK